MRIPLETTQFPKQPRFRLAFATSRTMDASLDIPAIAFPWSQPFPKPSALDIHLPDVDLGGYTAESVLSHFVGVEAPARQGGFAQLGPMDLQEAIDKLQHPESQDALPSEFVAWIHERRNGIEPSLWSSRPRSGPLTVSALYQRLQQQVAVVTNTNID